MYNWTKIELAEEIRRKMALSKLLVDEWNDGDRQSHDAGYLPSDDEKSMYRDSDYAHSAYPYISACFLTLADP